MVSRSTAAAALAACVVVCGWLADHVLKARGFGQAVQLSLYDEYVFTFCHRGPSHARQGYDAPKVAWCPGWIRKFDWFFEQESNMATKDLEITKTPRLKQWVIAYLHRAPEHRRSKDPSTVYVGAHAVERLLATAEADFDASRADRTVVFTSADVPLSDTFGRNASDREAMVARLRRYFSRIFFISKDVELEGVRGAVMGLDDRHFTGRGVAEAAHSAIAGARLDREAKPRQLLVAFRDTMFYCDLNVDAREGWRRSCRAAAASRKAALAWAGTEAAARAGVEQHVWPQEQYWRELPKFRFLLSPWGIGVQSPKTVEALVVLTIPIVLRAPVFDDLRRQGFPIVIVDDWSEITGERLEAWWKELSPRLASFRRNCLTADGYYRLVTGERESCA